MIPNQGNQNWKKKALLNDKKQELVTGRRKLLRFFDLPDENRHLQLGGLLGGLGGAMGGGDVGKNGGISTKDGLKVSFPPLPEPMKSPITINTPAAAYPTVVTDAKQQKPIVLVHEILEPKIKKRVIVHHNTPFMEQYAKMAHSINPYYMRMATQNPYYTNFAKQSSGFQGMIQSPEFRSGYGRAGNFFPKNKSLTSSGNRKLSHQKYHDRI